MPSSTMISMRFLFCVKNMRGFERERRVDFDGRVHVRPLEFFSKLVMERGEEPLVIFDNKYGSSLSSSSCILQMYLPGQ